MPVQFAAECITGAVAGRLGLKLIEDAQRAGVRVSWLAAQVRVEHLLVLRDLAMSHQVYDSRHGFPRRPGRDNARTRS